MNRECIVSNGLGWVAFAFHLSCINLRSSGQLYTWEAPDSIFAITRVHLRCISAMAPRGRNPSIKISILYIIHEWSWSLHRNAKSEIVNQWHARILSKRSNLVRGIPAELTGRVPYLSSRLLGIATCDWERNLDKPNSTILIILRGSWGHSGNTCLPVRFLKQKSRHL